jgi:hypothetical protein
VLSDSELVRVLPPQTQQAEVFGEVENLCRSVLDGRWLLQHTSYNTQTVLALLTLDSVLPMYPPILLCYILL